MNPLNPMLRAMPVGQKDNSFLCAPFSFLEEMDNSLSCILHNFFCMQVSAAPIKASILARARAYHALCPGARAFVHNFASSCFENKFVEQHGCSS
jgi:hypothetical protein